MDVELLDLWPNAQVMNAILGFVLVTIAGQDVLNINEVGGRRWFCPKHNKNPVKLAVSVATLIIILLMSSP